MSAEDERTSARNARLDALVTATKEYTAKARKRLQGELDFAKRVLKGRGYERPNQEMIKSASALVVDEIDKFLGG